jgi:hypothetical protein
MGCAVAVRLVADIACGGTDADVAFDAVYRSDIHTRAHAAPFRAHTVLQPTVA